MHSGNAWKHRLPIFPTLKVKSIDLILGSIVLVLVAALAIIWWNTRPFNSASLSDNSDLALHEEAPEARLSVLTGDLSGFERNVHDLAASNSEKSFQALLQLLKQSEPLSKRNIVIAALKEPSAEVVPILLAGLKDSDQGVRAGAAQILGQRREYQAIAPLTEATRDQSADVRRQAVKALSGLSAWQVLPRLDQLLLSDDNSDVRLAVITTKESFKQGMAKELGVPASRLLDLSVTSGDLPQIYAVTSTDLYARHGTAWTLVSHLPDEPLALATGNESKLIYLATVSAGLYRSRDGGETWEHVQFGLQTATRLTVTAIVVDPQNSSHLYVALASPGAQSGTQDPVGISQSWDSGTTWSLLEDSPMDAIITRLVLDPQWQGNLFGKTGNDRWRYTLPTDNPSDSN